MVDIQTISIAVASASVTVAAIYYVWQIRHQTKLRQTDILLRLFSKVTDRDFLEAWQRFSDFDTKDYAALIQRHGSAGFFTVDNQMILKTLEEVGVLLMRKLIDINLVDPLMHEQICFVWEKAKPFIEDARKTCEMPNLDAGLEYLYSEVRKKRAPTSL